VPAKPPSEIAAQSGSPPAPAVEATTPVAGPAAAPLPDSGSVPLVAGLTFTSALRFPDGDRENLIRVLEVSPAGVGYSWYFRQRQKSGELFEHSFERFVRATDFESAPRFNDVFTGQGRSQTPGYTTFTISRATYARLRAEGAVPYTVVSFGDSPLSGRFDGLLRPRVTLKGTLSLVSPTPRRMPVLLNGERVSVPVLHLQGTFAFQEQKQNHQMWVLADSAHPVVLRSVVDTDTLQTVRIDLPQQEERRSEALEMTLERDCRVELPGVYFAFASAELEPASAPAISAVASLLTRNPDWALTIEGHTDSVGTRESNRTLSMRRAESVRAALVERYGVSPSRLDAAGFGAERPREPNTTLEGRARNRRVELTRKCAAGGA
jgi:outer membrane protein OmpA-like peptidoglycan-associated protein